MAWGDDGAAAELARLPKVVAKLQAELRRKEQQLQALYDHASALKFERRRQRDRSVRTVEVHRARVFDKMEVKSAVELSRLLQQL